MLPRLLPYAVTPSTLRPPTITPPAYVMPNPARIRRGRQQGSSDDPARKAARATRATSAVGRSSPFPAVSRQPSAFEPSASSLQPLTRATRTPRQSLRAVQPTSHPSGARQGRADPASFRPMHCPIRREASPKPRQPPH